MRLNKLAVSATLHCLTGCAIGEVLGMIIGTGLGFSDLYTIILAVALAFLFGYALSLRPLIKSNIPYKQAMKLVLAADTLSITIMEIVDNFVMLIIPGAMGAGLGNLWFWFALVIALSAAFVAAYPVNAYLLKRGKGHALIHKHHHHNGHVHHT